MIENPSGTPGGVRSNETTEIGEGTPDVTNAHHEYQQNYYDRTYPRRVAAVGEQLAHPLFRSFNDRLAGRVLDRRRAAEPSTSATDGPASTNGHGPPARCGSSSPPAARGSWGRPCSGWPRQRGIDRALRRRRPEPGRARPGPAPRWATTWWWATPPRSPAGMAGRQRRRGHRQEPPPPPGGPGRPAAGGGPGGGPDGPGGDPRGPPGLPPLHAPGHPRPQAGRSSTSSAPAATGPRWPRPG